MTLRWTRIGFRLASPGLLLAASALGSAQSPGQEQRARRAMLVDRIERPLRYRPEAGDFVITDGTESFNRPLYGGSSAFRVDAGDRPEYSLYLPGRGGNLRLGIATAKGTKWLRDAEHVVSRYRPGAMIHEIGDRLIGDGTLRLTAVVPPAMEALILRIEVRGRVPAADLLVAYGGITGERGRRDGDIGTEPVPVREFFRLQAEHCRENDVRIDGTSFLVRGRTERVQGVLPGGTALRPGAAVAWERAEVLFAPGSAQDTPAVATGRLPLTPGRSAYLSLQRLVPERPAARPPGTAVLAAADLPQAFAEAETHRQALVGRVRVQTPDAYLDAAVGALNVAAEAVWDDTRSAYLHGGVAWRVPLLGWRVGYAGDALGWHERTRAHFDGYAVRQNTDPVPDEIPAPEASANLSRNETALHSNGDMTRSHYDMNLVGVDTFFRHLLWTGDIEYARRQWPVIERHLAWERRLFRREFGPRKLPLYEAYCCIWASDDLAYNGGGATHASAYNLFHNRMAARVAGLVGADPSVYENEAALLARGMRDELWLSDRGWFAEWRDLLGRGLVHPNAAAWTFYHALDSGAASPLEAWQTTRYVDTQLPHFPLRGPGVPAGSSIIATTSWMPYTWSLNNVVFAETVHTALGMWQANRPQAAYPLLRGALLDSMYLGLCPGNVGMCSWFDAQRRETQRDFGDGIGILARGLIEGLFGVVPDLLAGELVVRPGFPADWDRAALHHPDLDLSFVREGERECYTVDSRFARAVALRLQVPALRDDVRSVRVNGRPARWRVLEDSVGLPRVEVTAVAAARHDVEIRWRGRSPVAAPAEAAVVRGAHAALDCGAAVEAVEDPQSALEGAQVASHVVRGTARGVLGARTVFARVRQGRLRWYQPIALEIRDAHPAAATALTLDWTQPARASRYDTVPLAAVFNARLDRIFRDEYLAPRSARCSLATPKQGFGSWCHPSASFEVDDSGLRAAAAAAGERFHMPNGVPFATPAEGANVAFVSQWRNHPDELTLALEGRARRLYLLMAGSTSAMQSRFDNGELIVGYTDGSSARLALHNPTTWWPIDQDYFVDDFAFRRPGPLPPRVDLASGRVRLLDAATFAGQGERVAGGAATVLDLTLDPSRELRSLTVRALANEVVIGLMSVTLERP